MTMRRCSGTGIVQALHCTVIGATATAMPSPARMDGRTWKFTQIAINHDKNTASAAVTVTDTIRAPAAQPLSIESHHEKNSTVVLADDAPQQRRSSI